MKKAHAYRKQLKTHVRLRGEGEIVVCENLVNYWFTVINAAIFNNALPKPTVIIVNTNKYFGMCISAGQGATIMKVSTMVKNRKMLIATVAHEMVHINQWLTLQKMDHGRDYLWWKKYFKDKYNILL